MARTASSNSRKSTGRGSSPKASSAHGQADEYEEEEPLWQSILLAVPRACGAGVRALTGTGEYDPAYRRDGLCFIMVVLGVLFCASECRGRSADSCTRWRPAHLG